MKKEQAVRKSLYRGGILHFSEAYSSNDIKADCFEDGALLVEGEKIFAVGNFSELSKQHTDVHIIDYRGKLIIPGLIDSHLHFPQTEMIASYGSQLITWLENYAFPTEHKFHSGEYCQVMAKHFLSQLINNGTTTAFAFPTVHKHSANALFEQASRLNMEMITGKVCMDRNCPEYLQDTPETAQRDSGALIEKWHGKGRNHYALTPRFAPTSTEEQLRMLGELALQYPSVFIQSHLSENKQEVEWVKNLYPKHTNYLDVYDSFHLLRERALFGHCIHLQTAEWEKMAETHATAVFCPTSNLFLGSGLFDLKQANSAGVHVALATDVGGGTSFNMLSTYAEAYKVGQLQEYSTSMLQGLYMMTQGPAVAYGLSHKIGNLNPGTYADFVILDPKCNSVCELRNDSFKSDTSDSFEDMLFALSFIGDDRAIAATYIAGQECKQSGRLSPEFSQESGE